jgi:hypothetical protein
MARMTTRSMLGICVWLAACDAGHRPELTSTSNAVPPDAGPVFTLRLKGTDAGDFLSARMSIQSVEVRSAQALLSNAVTTRSADLTTPDQAFLLTSFQVPSGVEDVEFAVVFGGGTIDGPTQSFPVDDSCDVLRLSGKVSNIAVRKHAVIELDLSRSFLPRGGSMMLVPHFRLAY